MCIFLYVSPPSVGGGLGRSFGVPRVGGWIGAADCGIFGAVLGAFGGGGAGRMPGLDIMWGPRR